MVQEFDAPTLPLARAFLASLTAPPLPNRSRVRIDPSPSKQAGGSEGSIEDISLDVDAEPDVGNDGKLVHTFTREKIEVEQIASVVRVDRPSFHL